MSLARYVLALIPFALVTCLAWVNATHQQQNTDRARTTISQRDRLVLLQQRRRAASAAATVISDAATSSSAPAEKPAAVQPQPKPTQLILTAKPVVAKSSTAAAADAASTAANAATAAAATASSPKQHPGARCHEGRKPFHTILTATAQIYQQWQCRVMYYHWKKQRALDPAGEACTELTGFTRLVAHQDGNPDGLEGEIPSYFVKEYSPTDLRRFKGYRVINRPYSVAQFMQTDYWKAIKEEYVYVAETDHIMTQPLPNRALLGSPMAYVFNYMGPNPAHGSIIKKMWPEGGSSGYRQVQSIGPSPIVIHKLDLQKIATEWQTMSERLKTDNEADGRLGWVIEMWGYAIAAAKLGLKHQEFPDFQVEPGALSSKDQMRGFPLRYWLFHYTYQFEYMLDGTACLPWTIGEFSLDKRHFSDAYPAHPLPQPPAKANPAAFYLLNAFNEAMGNISNWPKRQPAAPTRASQSLYGRRRLDWFSRHQNGFATELRTMPLVKSLAGTSWRCKKADGSGGEETLGLEASGDWHGLDRGRWGSMNDPTFEAECPVYACIFLDGAGKQMEAKVTLQDSKPVGLAIMRHKDLAPLWTCVV